MILEQLYRNWHEAMLTRGSHAQLDVDTHAKWYDNDNAKGLPLHPSETLAKLYVIARDQGMNAAMMWKLSQP